MDSRFIRTEILIGQQGLAKLITAKIIIFGVGGVGSFAAEALSRAGVGSFVLVDYDDIDTSNINRQIPALTDTIGRSKVDVMKERMININPEVQIETAKIFCTAENVDPIIVSADPDFIVDAVDNVTAKVHIIKSGYERKIPLISAMGAGNKMDPEQFTVNDIEKTHTCPLARDVRKQLRKLGIEKGVKVVFSTEKPIQVDKKIVTDSGKVVPGSISFMPSTVGLLMASFVVKSLLSGK